MILLPLAHEEPIYSAWNMPMDFAYEELESLWDRLLSRQPEQVREAFHSLSETEKAAVLQHLERMANESGWHPEQRLSAEQALQALKDGI
ncbi:MAG: hypothetical protein JXB15_01820 [Anaerolineales bacterium]|nr:hypothetical protein [Anaerolineales bacterium]